MSVRSELVERLAVWLQQQGLGEVYGVIETNHKQFRSLTFCKARILDGEVRVYGPKFIQVKWQTALRALEQYGNRVFESEKHALDFLQAAFVDFDYDKADSIPVKGKR